MLYIVATPIGNLGDITYRAVEILKEVDLILCEDTRQARKLLNHYEIDTAVKVYHAHSHEKASKDILRQLREGQSIALISDAGTPLINDPGILLIKEAIENEIIVIPVPGASAFLAALVASGLDTNKFSFWGFVPHKKGRQTFWKKLNEEKNTIVFYESCHRIMKALTEMTEFCPEKKVVVGRELTKKFEEFVRGTPAEVLKYFTDNVTKGEFVLVVGEVKQ